MKVSIIGGGIAGLFIGLRLLDKGFEVILFDTNLIGHGSSTKNHGVIHSGGLYSELHPHLVKMCVDSQELFKAHFNQAPIQCKPSIYFGTPEKMKILSKLWREQGIEYSSVSQKTAREYLIDPSKFRLLSPKNESIFSSKDIVEILCEEFSLRGGITQTNTHIKSIEVSNGKASGVRSSEGVFYPSDIVINSSGIGVYKLLDTLGSSLTQKLRSRLDTMLVVKNLSCDRMLASTEFGGPVIVPGNAGYLLISRYGGNQPLITSDEQLRLPTWGFEESQAAKQAEQIFHSNLLDKEFPISYSCTKTEVISNTSDFSGVNPSYFIYDHSEEGISNVYTYLAGKMTFTFHSSQDLLSRILQKPLEEIDLNLPKFKQFHSLNTGLVSREPWKSLL